MTILSGCFSLGKWERGTLSLAFNLKVTIALVLMLFAGGTTATVYLPQYNRTFASMPGLFGGTLSSDENDPPVKAYLTLIPSRQYMCPDELKRIRPKPSPDSLPSKSTMTNDSNKDNRDSEENFDYVKMIEPLTESRDGLPIALLVERGMCTFHEKAVMASKYGPTVKYVIIYDNQIAPDLVPMSSDESTDMTLLFVSSLSGQELRDIIFRKWRFQGSNEGFPPNNVGVVDPMTSTNSNTMDEGNQNDLSREEISLSNAVLVHLDGIAPNYEPTHPVLNVAAYFLAAMSGFLAFLIFFGCLLICAQCGCITAAPDEHGRIVLFTGGPGIRPGEGLGRIIRVVDKLTPDQVRKHLTEEEFRSDDNGEDDEDDGCCCAICLDDFEERETIKVLPCNHKFHDHCLTPWLTERHASCPLCKFDVLKHVMELEKKTTRDSKTVNEEGMEVADGSSNATSATTSNASGNRGSSPVRSVWYRLRGWSPIANTAPVDIDGETNANNAESMVSEIEMEDRTLSATNDHDDAEMTI